MSTSNEQAFSRPHSSLAGSPQQAQPADTCETQREAQQMQEEAQDMLVKALEVVKSNSQSPSMQPGQADFLVVASVMAPIVMQLAKSNSVLRHVEASTAAASDKTESYHVLLATALASQSQQIHQLAQLQAASLNTGNPGMAANCAQPSTQQQPVQPMLNDQLKQHEHEAQQHVASQQQAHLRQQRFIHLPGATSQSQNSAAVPTSTVNQDPGELFC